MSDDENRDAVELIIDSLCNTELPEQHFDDTILENKSSEIINVEGINRKIIEFPSSHIPNDIYVTNNMNGRIYAPLAENQYGNNIYLPPNRLLISNERL